MKKVYVAFTVTSEFGHRGGIIGVFEDHDEAVKAVKGRGFWGSDGDIQKADYHPVNIEDRAAQSEISAGL